MRTIPKPEVGEYAPYTMMYIGLLPEDGRVLDHLAANLERTRQYLSSLPESLLGYRYAEGKWTIKEVLGHVIDDERIYAYRALRFARHDDAPLPGFEQDDYVPHSRASTRSLPDLLDEFESVRRSTITLFDSFDDAALERKGWADGKVMSVRAAAYHIAGHELHHVNLIRERYTPDARGPEHPVP